MENADNKLYDMTYTYNWKLCYQELTSAMNHFNGHNDPGAFVYDRIGPGDFLMKIESDPSGYGLYYIVNKKLFCCLPPHDVKEIW